MSKEFRSLQNQITELKSRLIEVEVEIKELKKGKFIKATPYGRVILKQDKKC